MFWISILYVHCCNISKHVLSISVLFCWIFENNCPRGGVLAPWGSWFRTFFVRRSWGICPFKKFHRSLPGVGEMVRLGIAMIKTNQLITNHLPPELSITSLICWAVKSVCKLFMFRSGRWFVYISGRDFVSQLTLFWHVCRLALETVERRKKWKAL